MKFFGWICVSTLVILATCVIGMWYRTWRDKARIRGLLKEKGFPTAKVKFIYLYGFRHYSIEFSKANELLHAENTGLLGELRNLVASMEGQGFDVQRGVSATCPNLEAPATSSQFFTEIPSWDAVDKSEDETSD